MKEIYSQNESEAEEIFEDVKHQIKNHENETSYGEPQAFVYLENERTIEITKEQEGLSEEDYFYSIRLHCSEEEFNNNDYHSTNGIIETYSVDINDCDLKDYLTLLIKRSIKPWLKI